MVLSSRYDPHDLEPKWQAEWENKGEFNADLDSKLPKYYLLEMFPYPSGNIHMGHVRNYSIGDVVARFFRMNGYNVLHPMGWDAFGLPAENAAIKNKVHPAKWTYANMDNMRSQLKRLGYSYDWSREIATCHPGYYKWEQLFFLRCLEKGMVYRKKAPQNWCPDCNTVLANEQVEEGLCWRCGSVVEQKELTQWFMRITDYAEELLAGLTELEQGWPERVLSMQRNWIGRSEGAELVFPLPNGGEIRVFSTRPDTIYGATFMTLAPEHPLVEKLIVGQPNEKAIRSFIYKTVNTSRLDRQSDNLLKEGIFTGSYCINPVTKQPIPIWLGNFVLAEYGTGAVMAVPAHDQRDFDFAKAYGLDVKVVIQPEGENLAAATMREAWTGPGKMVNSGRFDGMDNESGKKAVVEFLAGQNMGSATVSWRLRDWNISRQRYWGAPIPVVYCDSCGMVPVREEDLPIVLPLDVQICDDGRSPLSGYAPFVDATCPKCGKPAKRETDTLDTFVESSWYFSRYADARNDKQAFDSKKLSYWMPVDQYIGGVEHAILHLLYARYFTRILSDLGFYPPDIKEPFSNLLTQGMVLKDGFKMSKSKGNVVEPSEMIQKYGADTVRLFCLFAAPPERDFDWSETGIDGSFRFLNRVWRLFSELQPHLFPTHACAATAADAQTAAARRIRYQEHATVKKVSSDIGNRFQFNTAISAIMELVNLLYIEKDELIKNDSNKKILSSAMATVLTMLFPMTPHICEELWHQIGQVTRMSAQSWPAWREDALVKDELEIVIQINGKLRGKIFVSADADKETVKKLALTESNIAKHLDGLVIKNIIIVPGKLVNIVAG